MGEPWRSSVRCWEAQVWFVDSDDVRGTVSRSWDRRERLPTQRRFSRSEARLRGGRQEIHEGAPHEVHQRGYGDPEDGARQNVGRCVDS